MYINHSIIKLLCDNGRHLVHIWFCTHIIAAIPIEVYTYLRSFSYLSYDRHLSTYYLCHTFRTLNCCLIPSGNAHFISYSSQSNMYSHPVYCGVHHSVFYIQKHYTHTYIRMCSLNECWLCMWVALGGGLQIGHPYLISQCDLIILYTPVLP